MKLSKTTKGYTLTMSQHELDVLETIYSSGQLNFTDALESGAFKEQSKGFITAAKKVGNHQQKDYFLPRREST